MALSNDHSRVNILDIRARRPEISILDSISKGLNPGKAQEKRMPTLLLYDEQGLKLFEDITYLAEYYLTNAEIVALTIHADNIARWIEPGSRLIELGSGLAGKILKHTFANTNLLQQSSKSRHPVAGS